MQRCFCVFMFISKRQVKHIHSCWGGFHPTGPGANIPHVRGGDGAISLDLRPVRGWLCVPHRAASHLDLPSIHSATHHSSINPSIQLPITNPSIHPPIHLSIHPSTHLCLQALPSPRCLFSPGHPTCSTLGSFPQLLNIIKSLLLNITPPPSPPSSQPAPCLSPSLLSQSHEISERLDFLSAPSPAHSYLASPTFQRGHLGLLASTSKWHLQGSLRGPHLFTMYLLLGALWANTLALEV